MHKLKVYATKDAQTNSLCYETRRLISAQKLKHRKAARYTQTGS